MIDLMPAIPRCSPFTASPSWTLGAMAFDHFVAIYNPLQFAAVLTNPRTGVTGLGLMVRSISLLLPLPILKKLSFCRSHVLAHSSCAHPNLLQLPCADVKVNSRYGLLVVLATFGQGLLSIIPSMS